MLLPAALALLLHRPTSSALTDQRMLRVIPDSSGFVLSQSSVALHLLSDDAVKGCRDFERPTVVGVAVAILNRVRQFDAGQAFINCPFQKLFTLSLVIDLYEPPGHDSMTDAHHEATVECEKASRSSSVYNLYKSRMQFLTRDRSSPSNRQMFSTACAP